MEYKQMARLIRQAKGGEFGLDKFLWQAYIALPRWGAAWFKS